MSARCSRVGGRQTRHQLSSDRVGHQLVESSPGATPMHAVRPQASRLPTDTEAPGEAGKHFPDVHVSVETRRPTRLSSIVTLACCMPRKPSLERSLYSG